MTKTRQDRIDLQSPALHTDLHYNLRLCRTPQKSAEAYPNARKKSLFGTLQNLSEDKRDY